ncbi:MAG: autotransporter domain-containing protein [Xanthobacteraceae bacterium]
MRRPCNSPLGEIAFIGAVLTVLMSNPQNANAACAAASSGTVNCDIDTTTHFGTNLNGIHPASSDRTQLFDNGAAVNGSIKSGATVSGFGLELTEGAATRLPIVMRNQGQVSAVKGGNALQLDGNGGPIRYFGDGSLINPTKGNAALSVDNVGGNVTIGAGTGAISGATGINASTTGTGALTIRTGSGLVSSTANDAISASTVNGPLNLTIGSGGVTTDGDGHSIDATSNNGNVLVKADGTVSGYFGCTPPQCNTGGVRATSTGSGNIVIGGSGTYSSSGGRGIYAEQNATGLGGILVTGSGPTLNGIAGFANAGSAIRAEIDNPANSSNIVVDRSGNITSANTFPATEPLLSISSDIHAYTFGTGNIRVTTGAGATLSNAGALGIDAYEQGAGSTGSINVSTGAFSKLTANGTGILADNWAAAIPASAGSTIKVTANGTINSGAISNLVGIPLEGAGSTATPAGIVAGYNGGPVFSAASTAPYTSCRLTGCTTLTPNPDVNGTVSVVNNATINAAGGNGIFAFNFGNGNVSVTSSAPIEVTGATAQTGIAAFSAERGNISVITRANVITGNGDGIHTNSAGAGTTTINVLAGTTQGGTSGITATAARGPIRIDNSATIQNLSGLASDLAVATSGVGDATLTNNAGAAVTGTVSMTGAKTNNFINAGVWNTSAVSTFAGFGSIDNGGTINVFGPTSFGGLTTLTNGGTLNLAAGAGGGVTGTLTIAGNLAFRSGALYIVGIAPGTSSLVNVSGTASLAGAVQGVLLPGAFSMETYTILRSSGLGGTTFSGFSNPGFTGSLTYTPTDVRLSLAANLGASGGLNANQQNVATAINTFFNSGGTLTPSVMPIFGLTGGNLANALTQVDGEVATDAARGGFQMMTSFLGLMVDPFVDGRLGGGVGSVGGPAVGFAAAEQASLPPDIALAYAGVLKAPPPAPFAQRWTAWGASYGGGNWGSGNAVVGSSNVATQVYGLAAGLDYHYSLDTIFGFALGGGSTNWGLSSGSGGRSDAFQAGVYGITRSGPAYLSAALAFANHWMTTNRSAMGDTLTANFDAQSYGARVEGGYRYATLPTLGVTPYAALQAQDFHTPSYSETDVTGGGFGLSYASMNATDVRSELGGRFDNPEVVGGVPLLLRARLAWAHDWVTNPSLGAAFESLPGVNFIVNGAPLPQNSALSNASAEFFLTPRLTFLVKFDAEIAPGSQTYAGSGMLRYSW